MNVPEAREGDLFLLFHHLPYDFAADPPLPLGSGVCLDITPIDWLASSRDEGLADYLLPGYSFPGGEFNNCCLRCFHHLRPEETLSPRDLLFLTVLALRLHAPIGISIGGEFRMGEADDRILEPVLYEMSSSWNMGNDSRYTPDSIFAAASIADRLVEICRLGPTRLQTSLILFGQVSIGFSKSMQLSYIGLFAALEALFVPTGKKAKTLAQRVSNFLDTFQFPDPMVSWIRNEYINGRHKLAHGIHDAAFGSELRTSWKQAFGRVHEITRLSLLGFLSFDNEKLAELHRHTGSTLQRELDTLSGASGAFLMNQDMWCG